MYLHAALGTAGGSLPYLTTRETFQAHHGELYLKKIGKTAFALSLIHLQVFLPGISHLSCLPVDFLWHQITGQDILCNNPGH